MPLSPKDLERRLVELGVEVPRGTIRRWASQGLIPSPVGNTAAARWPDDTPERVVAIAKLRADPFFEPRKEAYSALVRSFADDCTPEERKLVLEHPLLRQAYESFVGPE
jgi:hypothetical protein